MTLSLLLLLGLSGALAAPTELPAAPTEVAAPIELPAPTEPPANPFLEGLDDFLTAFDGFALPGDPVAEVAPSPDPQGSPSPAPEQNEADIVTEEALCLGCVQEIESVGAEFRRVAQLAAELLEAELNLTQVTEVTQVYRAAQQVVNGIKYFLTLELLATNCSRPREEADVCLVEPEAERLLYAVEILEHPQQDLGIELLLANEVSPEEVADLPGLFTGPELLPPPPSPPAAEEPGLAGIEADLAALISDMERFTGLAAPV